MLERIFGPCYHENDRAAELKQMSPTTVGTIRLWIALLRTNLASIGRFLHYSACIFCSSINRSLARANNK